MRAKTPLLWNNKRYHSLNYHLQQKFGGKVIKISLNAGFTCPNRDGTLSNGGCFFCSQRGSGDFTGESFISLEQQFARGREIMNRKWTGNKYIAYFQSFSNTYGPIDKLKNIYRWAIQQPGVVGIAIATRPDCLGNDVLDLLEEINSKTYLWVELGLQTMHQRTASMLNMHYNCSVFLDALNQLNHRHIETCAHIIFGLPEETYNDMLKTSEFVASQPLQGIKIHLLHLLKGTLLVKMFKDKNYQFLSKQDYVDLVVDTLERLSPDVVIHRLTGDGPRKLLIGPEWSLHKKDVLNSIDKRLIERNTWQGRLYSNNYNSDNS